MEDQTTTITKPAQSTDGSKAFGVSIRGWLALLLTITVCLLSVSETKVEEPLYSLSIACLSYYFGNATKPTTPKQ